MSEGQAGQVSQAPEGRTPANKQASWPRRLLRWIERVWSNPIVFKELRARVRGWRAAVILIAQLVVMSCFASIIYYSVSESATSMGSVTVGQMMGQALFYSTYMLLLVVVVFLSPAFTAGTISGERERKTLDLLITTLIPTRSLVLGKLISALAYMVLLILIALPIQSLALMFGGVTLAEMLIGTLILLVTALVMGSVGVFISSLMKSSIWSTVLTYATILLMTIGLPIVVSILSGVLATMFYDHFEEMSWVSQAILIYTGGFLLCTNPFAVAVTSKLVEDAEDTLFFWTTQVYSTQGNAHSILLVSPWVVYVLYGIAASAVLIACTVLVLRRKRG